MDAPSTDDERHAQARMRQMYELIELLTGWFDEVERLEPDTVVEVGSESAEDIAPQGRVEEAPAAPNRRSWSAEREVPRRSAPAPFSGDQSHISLHDVEGSQWTDQIQKDHIGMNHHAD